MKNNFLNKLRIKIKKFSKSPGVYLIKNAKGEIIYIGKAVSLKNRVTSYFDRLHDSRIEKMVTEIFDIDYQVTPTVIEALILEANLIKKYQPKYNVKEKDDKSFLYVVFTNEKFPRIMLMRGQELQKIKNEKLKIKKTFGPYTSATSLRAALDILRKIFPYRDCATFLKRPCLQYHLKRCGAPCVSLILEPDYKKNIKNLILFFKGKKEKIIKSLNKEMNEMSHKENFEMAAKLRNQIFALKHIQDVAVIANDELQRANYEKEINIFGRIEGYDVSNIKGISATGSMVVFENGKPNKNEYRKFKIKNITTPNDVGMIKEVIIRRLKYLKIPQKQLESRRKMGLSFPCFRKDSRSPSESWVGFPAKSGTESQRKFGKIDLAFAKTPDLILIDGGWGQINIVREILSKNKIKIPVLGIAKGFDRKQDRLIHNQNDLELERVAKQYKKLLLQVRNEAHRFAQSYHKILRRKKLLE